MGRNTTGDTERKGEKIMGRNVLKSKEIHRKKNEQKISRKWAENANKCWKTTKIRSPKLEQKTEKRSMK